MNEQMNPILKIPPPYTYLTLMLCPDYLTSSDYMSLVSPPQVLLSFLTKASMYRVILSVLDPRKCEYLKDYSLDFEHAYMTTYLAS